jgi:hypothetical protein
MYGDHILVKKRRTRFKARERVERGMEERGEGYIYMMKTDSTSPSEQRTKERSSHSHFLSPLLSPPPPPVVGLVLAVGSLATS